jgi:hypothetical protein
MFFECLLGEAILRKIWNFDKRNPSELQNSSLFRIALLERSELAFPMFPNLNFVKVLLALILNGNTKLARVAINLELSARL